MKYKVTVSALFIAGQKYKRGDIVELSEQIAATLGTNLEPVVVKEEPKPKPKRTRKPKVESVDEDR